MDSKIWYIPAINYSFEKKVGIYCRVSTNKKDQLYSLAAQISALTRAVANVSQWRLADVFIDIASAKGEVPGREFEDY
jgi:site-specific DNA recombinase